MRLLWLNNDGELRLIAEALIEFIKPLGAQIDASAIEHTIEGGKTNILTLTEAENFIRATDILERIAKMKGME